MRVPRAAAVLGVLIMCATAAPAIELAMPYPVLDANEEPVIHDSYALPVGAWADGHLPVRMVEGAVRRRAWRLDAEGATLLDAMAPLRAELVRAGYDILLDCKAVQCGGFDFRFATEVMPDPVMHVDLGDFLFVSAARGDEAASILVSRSARALYVQVISVAPWREGAQGGADGNETGATRGTTVAPGDDGNALPASSGDITARLDAGLAAPLDDLTFATGAATLREAPTPATEALSLWLHAHPGRRIILVGHTDMAGDLALNMRLARQRAESVRTALVRHHGIAPARIRAEGIGPLAPRATNATAAGRAKNRRVEVVPVPDETAP